MNGVQQLVPYARKVETLQGLYLDLLLHQQADAGQVLIYSNYIASLDGRIALHDEKTGVSSVPADIANARDWRLYQELAAQADVMLTSARYFRQLAQGCAQDLLPVGSGTDFEDLGRWRQQQGLRPQPDVVIVSASLDIPLSSVARFSDRKILVMTVAQAPQEKLRCLQQAGIDVLIAGETQVDGMLLQQHLTRLHYRSAYMIAGPQLHATLLRASVLHRLFLTTHMTLLGQDTMHTILQGAMPAVSCTLASLYWDDDDGQLFAQYHINGESHPEESPQAL